MGLDQADLVYVAFPGPARQRLLALYQSKDVSRVGPVAQTRPMDGKLLQVFRAVLQYSGGPASFVDQLKEAKVPEWSALVRSAGFLRDASGNLYAATEPARTAPGASRAVAGVLPFVSTAPPGGSSSTEVRVAVPSQPELVLRYDGARKVWSGDLGELPVRATNILLQEVKYERLVLPHTGRLTEGDPVLVGEKGDATILSGTRTIRGTWNRRGRASLTSFVGSDGVPVRLAPGVSWVLLLPTGSVVQD